MLKLRNKKISFLFIIFCCFPFLGFTQECQLQIKGQVVDHGTDAPLELVNVFVSETQGGVVTDSSGYFEIGDLCPGEYHLVLSHVGCESQQVFIGLTTDTTLYLDMDHSHNFLEDVVVKGKSEKLSTQKIESINEQKIVDQANKNLSNILESVVGVSTLKNGSGISKPVVHGLYGNRLIILNNGIAQSGQQWGSDHSPEIDPLVANKISVIKGTAALAYMGASLGSVVLIEPKKIAKEPHLHGRASYFYETNGRGHGANVQIQKFTPALAWKLNGTLKKSGDKKSANYFLNNTGIQEANLALQLEKYFSDRWSADLYLSTFNTSLGVLRGSHIGNTTDLESAFQRDFPFFTEEDFSYAIEAPRQGVNHHLLKLHSKYFLDDQQWLDFTFAGQVNQRKEFDVRRSGRSDIPALSLLQYSWFGEGQYRKALDKQWILKTGLQFNVVDNTNDPETGVLPLIPDYLSYETGIYVLLSKIMERSLFEIGGRYDNRSQEALTIDGSSREIVRYNNNFHNWSTTTGWTYSFSGDFTLSANVGLGQRSPAINELYSNGLHQGVSGIELGNIALLPEQSLKSTLSWSGNLNKYFSIETLFYFQRIKDYIFLDPQEELRLTIRGAFPVFAYAQTDAQIYGFDVLGKWEFNTSWQAKIKYSFIRGDDLSQDLPLINIPANNFSGDLLYAFAQPIAIGKKQLENVELEWQHRYVFRQHRLLPEQDFVSPPDAYYLMGFKMAADLQWGKKRLRLIANVNYIFNIAYRDYLNRQRYFADDLGINGMLGINLKF